MTQTSKQPNYKYDKLDYDESDYDESDFDYYIIVKLANGETTPFNRIDSITSIAQIEAYAKKEQENRPLDQVYWAKHLEQY